MTEDDIQHEHVLQGIDDAPSARFLAKVLLDANKQRHEKIHFDPDKGDANQFVAYFENDGQLKEISAAPIKFWPELILRLRFFAGLDTRGAESRGGNFFLRLSKNRAVRFQVLADPYPEPKKKVTIINKSIDETPVNKAPSQSFEEVENRIKQLQKCRSPKGPI